MIALVSVLLLVAAPSATATASAATSASPVQPTAPKEEKKICKRDDDTTSRLGAKRICLTASEWRDRQDGNVKGLGDVTK